MGRRTHSRRTHRDDRGAALVEFALAFPVLMLVVLFALGLLWATFVQVAAGQAAREGARYASVALAPTYRTHPDAAAITARVADKVPVLKLDPSNVTVEYPGCAAPCPTPPSNTPVVVTVRKTLPGLFHGIEIKATSTGEVRAE
jgi:Flp pilus assembly protein TadG